MVNRGRKGSGLELKCCKNASGTILLLVDPVTGDLKLSGKLYERRTAVTEYPAKIFSIADASGEVIAFVTSSQFVDILIDLFNPFIPAGSLILEGKVIQP